MHMLPGYQHDHIMHVDWTLAGGSFLLLLFYFFFFVAVWLHQTLQDGPALTGLAIILPRVMAWCCRQGFKVPWLRKLQMPASSCAKHVKHMGFFGDGGVLQCCCCRPLR